MGEHTAPLVDSLTDRAFIKWRLVWEEQKEVSGRWMEKGRKGRNEKEKVNADMKVGLDRTQED